MTTHWSIGVLGTHCCNLHVEADGFPKDALETIRKIYKLFTEEITKSFWEKPEDLFTLLLIRNVESVSGFLGDEELSRHMSINLKEKQAFLRGDWRAAFKPNALQNGAFSLESQLQRYEQYCREHPNLHLSGNDTDPMSFEEWCKTQEGQ